MGKQSVIALGIDFYHTLAMDVFLLILAVHTGLGGIIMFMAGWYYLCAEDQEDPPPLVQKAMWYDVLFGSDVLWRLYAIKRNWRRNPLAIRLMINGSLLLGATILGSMFYTD